jgi:uncharacterized metal-binding protein YceD (DUF177 family)
METIGTVLNRIEQKGREMRTGFPDLMYEAKQDDQVEIPADGISLDLLQAVYRNSSLPLPVRMRAAVAALPHEVPKLMANAIINENSFAELLDRRLARIEQMKLIEARPTPETNGKTDVRLPPRVPFDKRYRRI